MANNFTLVLLSHTEQTDLTPVIMLDNQAFFSQTAA